MSSKIGNPSKKRSASEPADVPDAGATAPEAAPAAPVDNVVSQFPDPPAADAVADVQAAAASLAPEPGPSAEALRAAGVDAGQVPGGRPAPTSGPISDAPAPERWSDRKIGRAKRSELAKRVRELESRVGPLGAAAPSAGEPGAPTIATDPVQELDDLFAKVLPALSAVLVYLVGPEMKLEPTDERVLAKTGAPAALPYYAKARAAAPVMPFLVAVGAVFGPKVVDVLKRKDQERKTRKASGNQPIRPPERIEPAKDQGAPPAGDRFGGPSE